MSHSREYNREYMRKYRASHPEKIAEYKRTQMERRMERLVVRLGVCLTREQRLAVIAAQDGDRDALWKASQSWTPEQHKFAKARWESLHPIHKDFSWGRY